MDNPVLNDIDELIQYLSKAEEALGRVLRALATGANAAPADTPPTEEKKPEPEKAPENPVTIKELRDAVKSHVNVSGSVEGILEILGSFGATSVSTLPEKDYAGFMDRLKGLEK